MGSTPASLHIDSYTFTVEYRYGSLVHMLSAQIYLSNVCVFILDFDQFVQSYIWDFDLN